MGAILVGFQKGQHVGVTNRDGFFCYLKESLGNPATRGKVTHGDQDDATIFGALCDVANPSLAERVHANRIRDLESAHPAWFSKAILLPEHVLPHLSIITLTRV
jgi:hypothetical protein